jgi:hypothetical protein
MFDSLSHLQGDLSSHLDKGNKEIGVANPIKAVD